MVNQVNQVNQENKNYWIECLEYESGRVLWEKIVDFQELQSILKELKEDGWSEGESPDSLYLGNYYLRVFQINKEREDKEMKDITLERILKETTLNEIENEIKRIKNTKKQHKVVKEIQNKISQLIKEKQAEIRKLENTRYKEIIKIPREIFKKGSIYLEYLEAPNEIWYGYFATEKFAKEITDEEGRVEYTKEYYAEAVRYFDPDEKIKEYVKSLGYDEEYFKQKIQRHEEKIKEIEKEIEEMKEWNKFLKSLEEELWNEILNPKIKNPKIKSLWDERKNKFFHPYYWEWDPYEGYDNGETIPELTFLSILKEIKEKLN